MTFKPSNKITNLSDKFQIFNLFKAQENPLLLIHRDMKPITDKSAKYDLIITPQFYMMKKDTLPIKYSFQAKKIAPSILDEFARDEELEYLVFKEEPKPSDLDEDSENGEESEGEEDNLVEWIFIGYNKESLENILLSKGLNPENIGKVYFIQQFKDQLYDKLLLMSQKEALTVINDIVTIVPRDLIDNQNIIFLENLSRPKKVSQVRFKQSAKVISIPNWLLNFL